MPQGPWASGTVPAFTQLFVYYILKLDCGCCHSGFNLVMSLG